jgi:hypothetical protein
MRGLTTWWCDCACGNQGDKAVQGGNLKNGTSKSCGCLKVEFGKSKLQDITGQKFGKLTVLKRGPNTKLGLSTWYCECDCGNTPEKPVKASDMKNGNTKSCGCHHKGIVQGLADKKKAKAAASFVSKSEDIHGKGAYDYSKVVYEGADVGVKIGCNTCGGYFQQQPNNHYSGQGCPKCASHGFNALAPAIFYYALLNLADGYVAYMIGITNKTFEKRYSATDRRHMRLIGSRSFPVGSDALSLETQLKQDNKHNLYLGDMPIDKGNTEVFSKDINPFNQPRQEAA